MSNPISFVPIATPLFDGSGDPDGKELVRKLGNLNRVWAVFFASESGWLSQGTHAERLATEPKSVPDGALFVETDRSAIYESRFVVRAQAWVLVMGAMGGLLAARPDDLATNDVGFIYNSSDALDYRWSGTAWVALDTVRGGTGLTHDGRLTMVSAVDGVISESAVTDNGTSVTAALRQFANTGTQPESKATTTGGTQPGRWGCFAGDGSVYFSLNLFFNLGTSKWNLDDTTKTGTLVRLLNDGAFAVFSGVVSGSPPEATLTQTLQVTAAGLVGLGGKIAPAYAGDATGDHNVSGVYRVATVQVVGPRGAALTAAGAAVTGTAVNPYDNTTRDIINNLVTLTTNLRTRVNELEARLSSAAGHGLIT